MGIMRYHQQAYVPCHCSRAASDMVVGTQLCCEWPHATTSTISAGQVLIQEWKPHVTHYLYSVLRLVMDTNHFRHTRYAVRIVAIVEATGARCQCETDILDGMHVLQTDLLPRNALV
jgi:hypothetical protein